MFCRVLTHPPPPCATYMCQWIRTASVQIMACRLLVPSHYLNQCWFILNWTLRNKFHWNFNQNTKSFIHKNASESIVCEMGAILSRGRWVNARKFGVDFFLSISTYSRFLSYQCTDPYMYQRKRPLIVISPCILWFYFSEPRRTDQIHIWMGPIGPWKFLLNIIN